MGINTQREKIKQSLFKKVYYSLEQNIKIWSIVVNIECSILTCSVYYIEGMSLVDVEFNNDREQLGLAALINELQAYR